MVTGGSYGGYMTLAVATMYSDRICAPRRRRRHLELRHLPQEHRELPPRPAPGRVRRRARSRRCAPSSTRSRRSTTRRRSPSRCSSCRAATTRACRYSEAEQMVERVKQNRQPVWYLMAKDEGHGFAKKGNADFQFYATVMFVRKIPAGPGWGGIESAAVNRSPATEPANGRRSSPAYR